MREIENALLANHKRLYHLGMEAATLIPVLPTEITAAVNNGEVEFSGTGTQFGIWKING